MIKKLFIHRSLPEMYNIDVDDNNKIYTEVSGKKNGIPVIFIHGGPGGHCRSEHHSLFDPEIYRSIIFDQRGCGKSKPYRSLSGNNTINLVEDIDKIREFFKIKKFLIVGGSWGATLAIKYALKYPKNLFGILLRSVFLGTENEIKWAFIENPKNFAPNLYETFLKYSSGNDLIASYYKKIFKDNSKLHSWIWHDYERILSQLNPQNYSFHDEKELLKRDGLPNSPFMELYYIKNNFFMDDNEILNNVGKISHIPAYIVQGRYDLICPPVNAFNLSNKWRSSKITFVNTAGHSSSDEGIIDNLLIGLKELTKHS
ncbi:MAG: alpha/beta fold hydrolase [Alphaproteobacteria bacterium]|tara:strand:- start:196 stop:1137 length:942 start_codon:yes stop_codon:yes gene_type:complete